MSSANGHVDGHPIERLIETDVLIVGSGPIGATYARKLVDGGVKVLMVDIGAQSTRLIGDHKKNSVAVQKDISLFTNSVKGELAPLSVPVDTSQQLVEPVSWTPGSKPFVHNGQNPEQKAWDNLPAAAATRVVGGMGSHWTCCTPRQFEGIERNFDLFDAEEWDELYKEAESLFHTNSISYDDSIRQELVKETLKASYNGKRNFISMPLACQRNQPNKEYLEWTATATILGDLADPKYTGNLFEFLEQHRCTKLDIDPARFQVRSAVLKDLLKDQVVIVKAKKYVICAGAVLTPGILFNSGFKPTEGYEALGHYMTEQTMAFCQIVLKRSLVEEVRHSTNPVWKKKVDKHEKKHPEDPLPFPFDDPDPQVYTPLSKEYPWHTQIHRDAFGYGAVPSDIDQRLVVDLRFFGYVKPAEHNWVEFSTKVTDQFGMPQPIFHFTIDDEDAKRTHDMIKDMVDVASHLGGYLPGAEPKYLAPGSALHICGTTRAGKEDDGKSVVDRNSQVWRQDDLFIGGCSVIPTQNACNPTLTAACFAIVGARKILSDLGAAKVEKTVVSSA